MYAFAQVKLSEWRKSVSGWRKFWEKWFFAGIRRVFFVLLC